MFELLNLIELQYAFDRILSWVEGNELKLRLVIASHYCCHVHLFERHHGWLECYVLEHHVYQPITTVKRRLEHYRHVEFDQGR